MVLYRFKRQSNYAENNDGSLSAESREIICVEYEVIKETNKSWIINVDNKKRVVSKQSKRKYAYPTIKEAMNNFILRTKKHLEILKYQINDAEAYLNIAEKFNNKYSEDDVRSLLRQSHTSEV